MTVLDTKMHGLVWAGGGAGAQAGGPAARGAYSIIFHPCDTSTTDA